MAWIKAYKGFDKNMKCRGFQFEAFRKYVAGMDDLLVAYNLDGGDSAVMVFNGEKINDPENDNERPLADIIYFASAYPGE